MLKVGGYPDTWSTQALVVFKKRNLRILFILTAVVAVSMPSVKSLSADLIKITDFGAVSNDDADDLASINKAISAAKKGDTVYFPKGIWLCKGTIELSKPVNLLGAGIENTILLSKEGQRAGPLLDLNRVRNVEISRFAIDANSSKLCSQGIEASHCSHLHIHSLGIFDFVNTKEFGPHGIYFSESVTDSIVENCRIANVGTNTNWGAGVRIHHGSHRCIVRSNRIDHTGRGGILCARSTDLKILKNHISNSGESAGEGLGIELSERCHRGLVEDNAVDHWISVDSCSWIAVRRNSVGTNNGLRKFAGLELADSTNCIFTGNTVDGGSLIGISISNTETKEYVFWGRNTIQNCAMWGAQLQGESGGARFMYFYDNTFSKSIANHPESLFKGSGGHGFRINGNTHSITFEANRFQNNEVAGIQILGDQIEQLAFLDNHIVDNGGGALVLDPKIPLQWNNNAVSGNLIDYGFEKLPVQRPAATFAAPQTAFAGETVTLKLDSTEMFSHLLWDFGDGVPVNSANPSHVYSTPGRYIVTLLVWDHQGRAARVERLIEITQSW